MPPKQSLGARLPETASGLMLTSRTGPVSLSVTTSVQPSCNAFQQPSPKAQVAPLPLPGL
jgi:hypothetical protein